MMMFEKTHQKSCLFFNIDDPLTGLPGKPGYPGLPVRPIGP